MSGNAVPWAVRRPVRRTRNALARGRLAARQWRRWRETLRTPPRRGEPAVSYGVERMPGEGDVVFGGAVKFSLLDRTLPNAPRDWNVLYLGSSALPLEAPTLVRLARRRRAPFVWNQNGVAYRGWYGDGWEEENRMSARLLHAADHVVYQTAFCRLAADRFLGPRDGGSEILPNPVDTERFRPVAVGDRPPTLLLGGNQYQRYRLERALEALAELRRDVDARLLVAGTLSFAADGDAVARATIAQLGLEGAVELVGPYTQAEAPALMARADVLLHPKVNDPCPTVVLEAMACGLAVVFSASGGTPELVGTEAGVGIPTPLDWERDHPPSGAQLAAATRTALEGLADRREAARARALLFDVRPWAARHRELFESLLQGT